MSNRLHPITRRVAAWFSGAPRPVDPETMPLRDWADLPAHHPIRDGAPR